jgi:hypothetical protein
VIDPDIRDFSAIMSPAQMDEREKTGALDEFEESMLA